MSIKHLFLNIEQLREFQNWKTANGDHFSLRDYLFGVSNVEVAIAFTKLFWPDFVEHDGGVFLSEAFDIKIYEQWKAEFDRDIQSIEKVINHQHIDDILPGADNVSIDNLIYLGEALAQMWESRLNSAFPNRKFKVICNHEDQDIVVFFYQIKGEE